jgi:hypothetical protein
MEDSSVAGESPIGAPPAVAVEPSNAVQTATAPAGSEAPVTDDGGSSSSQQQRSQHKQDRPKLVPRVLQLNELPNSAARGKRGAPATPSKAPVADESSPGSIARQVPKRLAVPVPVELASDATLQKTDPTECRSGPYETADSDVSDDKDSESSESEPEPTDREKITIAMIAAMSGNENARAYILNLYTQGKLPPDLASRANDVLRRTLDGKCESSEDEELS